MNDQIATPEIDKLKAVSGKSQTVGEFIEWLHDTKDIVFAKEHKHSPTCDGWDEDRGRYNPGMTGPRCPAFDGQLLYEHISIEKLLAEFFEIDLKKIEKERDAILSSLRKIGGK